MREKTRGSSRWEVCCPSQFKTFPESPTQEVHLIQGVQVWQNGQVRPRSSASGEGTPIKKRSRRTIVDDEAQAISLSNIQQNATTDVSMKDVKRKTRKPARRLEVSVDRSSIWDVLSDTKVNMSFKEWLTIDKQAAKDLCDGIRYLHGRKPRTPKSNSLTAAQVNAVNLAGSDDGEESDEEGEEKEEWDELEEGDGESVSESYLLD